MHPAVTQNLIYPKGFLHASYFIATERPIVTMHFKKINLYDKILQDMFCSGCTMFYFNSIVAYNAVPYQMTNPQSGS